MAQGRAEVGGALDAIDDAFHDTYDKSRKQRASDVPVWIVLADELVCYDDKGRTRYSITPRGYQLLKKVAHVPLAIFSAAHGDDGREDANTARREHLRAWVREAIASTAHEESLKGDTGREVKRVLDACDACLQEEHTTRERAEALAREVGPMLRDMIREATASQLEALDEATERALEQLTEAQRRKLQVVVTGNHQARVRSLPMQYFRLRMREPEETEERVTYAEGVSSEEDALAMVGTRRLDHAIARAFFDDPQRMQRDLLGDAARDLLQASPPLPI